MSFMPRRGKSFIVDSLIDRLCTSARKAVYSEEMRFFQ